MPCQSHRLKSFLINISYNRIITWKWKTEWKYWKLKISLVVDNMLYPLTIVSVFSFDLAFSSRHYLLSQLNLVRTSEGITGKKIQSFCGKYNAELSVPKVSWFFSDFFKKKICFFTMAFNLDQVKYLLDSNSVSEPRNAQSVISNKLKKAPFITQRKLYELSQ